MLGETIWAPATANASRLPAAIIPAIIPDKRERIVISASGLILCSTVPE
jgi:hypothetical protein